MQKCAPTSNVSRPHLIVNFDITLDLIKEKPIWVMRSCEDKFARKRSRTIDTRRTHKICYDFVEFSHKLTTHAVFHQSSVRFRLECFSSSSASIINISGICRQIPSHLETRTQICVQDIELQVPDQYIIQITAT